MRVVTGQKGSWGFRARVRGHEVHSSLLHTGVSAIHEAARFIAWTQEEMARAAAEAPDNPFDPPWTTIHVGLIEGGTANNITARTCTFSGEVRCLPDQDPADWRARLLAEADRRSAAMRAIAPGSGFAFEDRMLLPGFLADGPAEALARALTGDNGRTVVSYQTEAGHFQARGLPTVICGPGSIAQAHQPDEFVSIAQFDAATDFVRRLVGSLAA